MMENPLPHFTVATIVEKDHRFLMVEEYNSNQQLVFNQPAGHVEHLENFIDAAIRETLEETAWHVNIQALLGIYHWIHPKKQASFIRTTFIAQPLADTKQALDEEIVARHWLTYEEIQARKDQLRSPLVLQSLDDYLQGKRFPLEIVSIL